MIPSLRRSQAARPATLVIAHRCHSAAAAENGIAALERAVGDADERVLDTLVRTGTSGLLVNDPGLGRRAVERVTATA